MSRPAADVLREAERLVAAGVKELLVISQDTSAYGVDIKYAASKWKDREVRAKFLDLARELGTLGAWVRLHYVYPYPHVDEVIPLMADGQGAALSRHPVPARVARRAQAHEAPGRAGEDARRASRAGASICPDLTLRSTFIVGFPGETEQDFEMLLDWLDEAALDRVGCFHYEPVRGAAANDLAAPVPDDVERGALAPLHGAPAGDLGEAPQAQGRHAASRSSSTRSARPSPRAARKGDAPEIDGAVYVASRRPLRVGEIATVKIERADEYDLHGTGGRIS